MLDGKSMVLATRHWGRRAADPAPRQPRTRSPAFVRAKPRVVDGREIADDVGRRVVRRTLASVEREPHRRLDEIVYESVYEEQRRLSSAEPDPRTTSDNEFVFRLKHVLAHGDESQQRELLDAIVTRYAKEVSGRFDPWVYRTATRIVPSALSVLLHGFRRGRGLTDPTLFNIEDRIVVSGEVQKLKQLARLGTVILAPTHVSNLDSLVLGSTIYHLGLPPFAYGAGLNLFTGGPVAFFMRHLGAYTVDRKKTDPLYRATLKEYVTALLERGQHNLFFAGGTRSRSGALESHLKMGLLGTAPEAYRRAVQSRPEAKIFVVPCTLTYPLVLEAATLVQDYLRGEGGAQYVDVSDEFEEPRRWLDFLGSLMKLEQRVHVIIGQPFDVVGNHVDEAGTSRDPRGRPVDASRYFLVDGRLAADPVRDAAYTRLLASRLIAAYARDNLALPTGVTAFAVLSLLHGARSEPDLFRFLRGVPPDASVDEGEALRTLDRTLCELRERAEASELRLHPTIQRGSPADVLTEALRTFATYHAVPVLERRGTSVRIGDVNLLFYYRNRLSGYGLLGDPDLLPEQRHRDRSWTA